MKLAHATHIEVDAGVRYWEDATIDGVEDIDGTLGPRATGRSLASSDRARHRQGCELARRRQRADPLQGLRRGALLAARRHGTGKRIARRIGYYVPDDFLCHGDEGFGDYIILNIGPDGQIDQYRVPKIDGNWDPLP